MDIIKYYRPDKPTRMPLWATGLLILAIPLLVLYVIVAIPVALLIAGVQVFFPSRATRLSRYWSEKGVEYIIGYDSSSKFAKRIVKSLENRHDIKFFDWKKHKGRKLKAIHREFPAQKELCCNSPLQL
jgi:hypothetical protein